MSPSNLIDSTNESILKSTGVISVLPSTHQIGDRVKVSYLLDNITATIRKISFSHSKVFYDITLDIPTTNTENPDGVHVTRLYNVDSYFVTEVGINTES